MARAVVLGQTTPLAPPLADLERRLARLRTPKSRATFALEILDLIFADHAAQRRVLSDSEFNRCIALKRAALRLRGDRC